jgi:hypothetical protein
MWGAMLKPSVPRDPPDRALLIREPYISLILSSRKRWELRGTPTKIRGRIGLVRSGSGLLIGECEIVGCRGPIDYPTLLSSADISYEERQELKRDGREPYREKDDLGSKTYAWVLSKPRVYCEPIRYRHPSGAITFVDLTKPGILEWPEVSRRGEAHQLQLF